MKARQNQLALKLLSACASNPTFENLQQVTKHIASDPTAFFETPFENRQTSFYSLLTQDVKHLVSPETKIAGASALLVAVGNAGFNPLIAIVSSTDMAIKTKRNELLALKLDELAEAVKFGNIMPDRLANYIFGVDEQKQTLLGTIQAIGDSTLQEAFSVALQKIDDHLNTTVFNALQDNFLKLLRKNLMAWENSQPIAERNVKWIEQTPDDKLAANYLHYLTNAPANTVSTLRLSLMQAANDSDNLPTQATPQLTSHEGKIALLQKEQARRFPLHLALQLLTVRNQSTALPAQALQLTLYLITCLTNIPALKWEALEAIHTTTRERFKLLKAATQQQFFKPAPSQLSRAQSAPAASYHYYLPQNLLDTVEEEDEKIETTLTTGNFQFGHGYHSHFNR